MLWLLAACASYAPAPSGIPTTYGTLPTSSSTPPTASSSTSSSTGDTTPTSSPETGVDCPAYAASVDVGTEWTWALETGPYAGWTTEAVVLVDGDEYQTERTFDWYVDGQLDSSNGSTVRYRCDALGLQKIEDVRDDGVGGQIKRSWDPPVVLVPADLGPGYEWDYASVETETYEDGSSSHIDYAMHLRADDAEAQVDTGLGTFTALPVAYPSINSHGTWYYAAGIGMVAGDDTGDLREFTP